MDLVIVESPSKAKTICKYLGSNYKVLASGGHVRDLPPNKLGVNVHNNFEPDYEVYPQKQNTIKQLKKEVANSEKVYLATDPDREGEAISWHLKHLLGIKEDNVRIVFNEITKKAVNKAITEPHLININLVNSQQARRVLDRLVGYLISPVLSKKIAKGLSAGRVQSVALRMIVDKEREILIFKPEEYWNIFAHISPNTNVFYKSQFNDINGKKKKINNQDDAMRVVNESKLGNWVVDNVKKAQSLSKPNPPFTTSTLQQDGVNKLNFSASQVMKLAQELYEGVNIKGEGQHALVTYIRTDSVRISEDAQTMAKEHICDTYGKEYYPNKPNIYAAKDNAQDAHEAIRPISLEYSPEYLKGKIESNQYRLYKLIYERFLASQMVNAEYDTLNVHIVSNYNNTKYGYVLKGKTMTFAGYTIVYQNSTEEDEDLSNSLPSFNNDEKLNLKEITHEQKFTKPPARYTDSSLVKAMEENGIGRPSTYASIISVLAKRVYTEKEGKFIKPTDLGMTVCDQLVKYFVDIMDTKFTAEMEKKLDTVEGGNVDWHTIVSDFYPGFLKSLEQANDGQKVKMEPILTDIICEKCGKPMLIRDGKYGKFLGCSGFPSCKNMKPYETEKRAEDTTNDEPSIVCDKCGKPMTLKNSRYGKFYGCTGYPDCKNIIKYSTQKNTASHVEESATVGNELSENSDKVICEKCGAEMVLKQGKFGKFYACPNYPECKNIVSIKSKDYMQDIIVVGGGLAGCEACYQLLKRGYKVTLYEMRRVKMTPCHSTCNLAELVCSNSMKSMEDSTASGTLKRELELLDSMLLRCAYKAKVPAGSALAVNREEFSQYVTEELRSFDNFELIEDEFRHIDTNTPTIIASGPLTSDSLAKDISKIIEGDSLHFYDAVAPIVSGDSLDYSKVFQATRYNKGDESDYLNAGMNREEYEIFYNALIGARSADLHEFDRREIFESCMPIEIMASRGAETIRYGMMKPVGIVNPTTLAKYYAVVQLRKENKEGTMYNLVGFQTNLTFSEQKRVFSLIPGLENAEFLRYGVMHRNTFLNSPKVLEPTFKVKCLDTLYFAGQITGVEGYVESIMSGLISAINLHNQLIGEPKFLPPNTTITGALMNHISTSNIDFQPMNSNFGVLPSLDDKIRDKKLRKQMYSARAVEDIKTYINNHKL